MSAENQTTGLLYHLPSWRASLDGDLRIIEPGVDAGTKAIDCGIIYEE